MLFLFYTPCPCTLICPFSEILQLNPQNNNLLLPHIPSYLFSCLLNLLSLSIFPILSHAFFLQIPSARSCQAGTCWNLILFIFICHTSIFIHDIIFAHFFGNVRNELKITHKISCVLLIQWITLYLKTSPFSMSFHRLSNSIWLHCLVLNHEFCITFLSALQYITSIFYQFHAVCLWHASTTWEHKSEYWQGWGLNKTCLTNYIVVAFSSRFQENWEYIEKHYAKNH